jgi:hypothetical protein
MQATRLLRVLPVAQSCAVPSGDLTIASIEVYADGCILQCHVIPSADAPPRFRPGRGQGYRRHAVQVPKELQARNRPGPAPVPAPVPSPRLPDDEFQVRMEDDTGTRYSGAARAGGGNNVRWDTSYGFVPGVPHAATRLRVLVYSVPSGPGSAPLHVFEVSLQG